MATLYFKLTGDMLVPDRWHLGDILLADASEPNLSAGIRLMPNSDAAMSSDTKMGQVRGAGTLLTAEVTRPGTALDFCVTAFNVPVARNSLANAIAKIADLDVQCIPVLAGHQAGFSVLNAVRLVRCVDEDRSEFLKWTERDHRSDLAGEYRSITRLRVDLRRIPKDSHFFRIADWRVGLIVSEQVKDAMERAGCVGAKFEEVTGASELS